MNKEKKIWLFEQYALKMWTLAINLTQEAARIGGNAGASMAVIAEECRHLSQKITAYVGEVRFHGGKDEEFKGIADAALQMNLLALNGNLESCRIKLYAEQSDYRSLSVATEEIRALACQISSLCSEQKHTPTIIPETIAPLKSIDKSDFFIQYSIGGIPFIESVGIVSNVEYPAKSAIDGDIFNLRGLDVRVIDLYKKFNLQKDESDRQTVIILCLDKNNYKNEVYLVPVDGVYGIVDLKIGYNVPPKAGHAFADYTRECWDAVGGDQFIFIDWDKFM